MNDKLLTGVATKCCTLDAIVFDEQRLQTVVCLKREAKYSTKEKEEKFQRNKTIHTQSRQAFSRL